jgi:hypothetical protein
MTTKQIKTRIPKRPRPAAAGVATRASAGAQARGTAREREQYRVAETDTSLLGRLRRSIHEGVAQARKRPLAVFGTAFVVALAIARRLRRRPDQQ